jgi:hypothetical protein
LCGCLGLIVWLFLSLWQTEECTITHRFCGTNYSNDMPTTDQAQAVAPDGNDCAKTCDRARCAGAVDEEGPDLSKENLGRATVLLAAGDAAPCGPRDPHRPVLEPHETQTKRNRHDDAVGTCTCVSCGGIAPKCGCAWQQLRQQTMQLPAVDVNLDVDRDKDRNIDRARDGRNGGGGSCFKSQNLGGGERVDSAGEKKKARIGFPVLATGDTGNKSVPRSTPPNGVGPKEGASREMGTGSVFRRLEKVPSFTVTLNGVGGCRSVKMSKKGRAGSSSKDQGMSWGASEKRCVFKCDSGDYEFKNGFVFKCSEATIQEVIRAYVYKHACARARTHIQTHSASKSLTHAHTHTGEGEEFVWCRAQVVGANSKLRRRCMSVLSL